MLRPHSSILAASLAALFAAPALANGPLVIRVGRAETATKGVIEHAVILVEDGKIVMVGEDLPVERGIPIIDRPEWTVVPGLISAYTRLGQDSEGGDDMSPDVRAKDELWPKSPDLRKVVEYGVTTLGIYPAGNGIPGLGVAIRPLGDSVDELVLKDPTYLKIVMRADTASKKRIKDGFKKADEHAEKVKKAKEKWDKDQEKKGAKKEEPKKEEVKKEDEKKDAEKKMAQGEEPEAAAQEPKPDAKTDKDKKPEFVPPAPDAKSRAFVELREKKLRALVSISSAAEYLHWLDALGKESIDFDMRIVLNQDSDVFYVFDKKAYDLDVDGIGDRKIHAVIEPVLTFTPNTRRLRNLPMELARAGAKVCFTPRVDELGSYKAWLGHVGELVAAGMKHDDALRALTIDPAGLLGVADRVGSIEKGKDANFVFLDGDPFEPATRIQAVMLDGKFVFGEVDQ